MVARRLALVLLSTAVVLALAWVLGGCSRNVKPDPVPVVPEPLPYTCAGACQLPCSYDSIAWAPTDPDSPEAFRDLIVQVVSPLREAVWVCEARRLDCLKCLDDLKKAGVIQ